MKKAQARANILAQDPMMGGTGTGTGAPSGNIQNPGSNGAGAHFAPPGQRQAAAGQRQRPPLQQGYYHPGQGMPPQQPMYQNYQNGPMQGYQPQYNQGYGDYQGQTRPPRGPPGPAAPPGSLGPPQDYHQEGYRDQGYQQQQPRQRQGSRPHQAQQRHVSHDEYYRRGRGQYEEEYYDEYDHYQGSQRAVSYDSRATASEELKSSEEQAKIQALEEKIQRLEKLVTMRSELEGSERGEQTGISQGLNTTERMSAPSSEPAPVAEQMASMAISSNSHVQTTTNARSAGGAAPPLPPPPPSQHRSFSSSPKASLFQADVEQTAAHDPLRLSTSSLIPTDKSLSDQSIEEAAEAEADGDADEPPPSYEELEKSGSLTYSKSIYRTGFEKAGYQLDHVQASPTTSSPPASTSSAAAERLLSKRRVPSGLKVEHKSGVSGASEASATSALSGAGESVTNATHMRKSPEPLVGTDAEPALDFTPPVTTRQTKRFTDDSLYGVEEARGSRESVPRSTRGPTRAPTTPQAKPAFIKYQTPGSYRTLNRDIIEPILPSKSEESVETIMERFRVTRDQALRDYNQFTPRIQFTWAIMLLETMSNQRVLAGMAIDGKLRKVPLSYKRLDKQRAMFLTTAVKVLEKLIQIAPDETRAKLYLGDIYSGGIHPGIIPRDERRGFQYFMDAAMKQEDPVGCYRVACCLESGVGAPQDVLRSTEFFQKGAELGDPSSMCQLGMMHFAGVNGCTQDINKSIQYHRQAYETLRSKTVMSFDPLISVRSYQDARGAFYTLAKIYQTDRNILCLADGSPKSVRMIEQIKAANVWCHSSRALKYYLEAAKLGHAESQASLGYYYSQGFFPTLNFKSDKEAHGGKPDVLDTRKSIYWFSKAASEGHVYAALGLARWYGSGAEGVLSKDEQQAFLWGRKAADVGGLPEAEYMVGMCYETGFGTPRSSALAAEYYGRSAAKGYRKARDRIGCNK